MTAEKKRNRYAERIVADLFDIASRLREIDDGYFILKNGDVYEVHNRNDVDSYCLTVPYSELDARTVDLVRKTRAERAAELFAEMERDNERLRRQALRDEAERATVIAERVLEGKEVI